MGIRAAVFVAAVSLFALASCRTAYEELDASPLPPTSFLPDSKRLVRQGVEYPFQYLWFDRSTDWKRFKKLKFAKVDVSHLLSQSWWESVNTDKVDALKAQAGQIGEYMRNAFIRDIIAEPYCSFVITDAVDSETAVIELALVQLVPTKAFFNAAGTVASVFIPGASLVASHFDAGCVAMECKIVDGRTGRVVAMLSDRERDRSVVLSVSNYTWYGHAKQIIDDWAGAFAVMADARNAAKAPDKRFPFALINL